MPIQEIDGLVEEKSGEEKKGIKIEVVLIALALLLFFAVAYLIAVNFIEHKEKLSKMDNNMFTVTKPKPSRSPKPIPHGNKDFSISQSDKSAPQMRSGQISPFDPEIGSKQSISVKVVHTKPVVKVMGLLNTDNSQIGPVEFKLVEGNNLDGTWQGEWQVDDSYLYTYVLRLNAVDNNGKESRIEAILRR